MRQTLVTLGTEIFRFCLKTKTFAQLIKNKVLTAKLKTMALENTQKLEKKLT